MNDEGLAADLLLGCVEIGGTVLCESRRLVFLPGHDGESIVIPFDQIVRIGLGGREGADANRLDLAIDDGRRITLLLLGRERIVEAILRHQGWEHGKPFRGV